MHKKLISVNITTYNRANLLNRCINSILNQSYEKIELIIVDDCSTDNTEEVIRNFQQKYNFIKYYKHSSNKGNAAARNTALENCEGHYVAFMDDDDEWIDNDKLKKQVRVFEKDKYNKLGIVCGGIRRVLKSGEEIDEHVTIPKDLKKKVLIGGLIHNSTVLTKKSFMLKVGAFDEKMSRGVDSEFFRRMIVMFNYSVHFSQDITCKYYEDCPNRMTTNTSAIEPLKKAIETHSYVLKKYLKYYLLYPGTFFIRLKTMFIIKLKIYKKYAEETIRTR